VQGRVGQVLPKAWAGLDFVREREDSQEAQREVEQKGAPHLDGEMEDLYDSFDVDVLYEALFAQPLERRHAQKATQLQYLREHCWWDVWAVERVVSESDHMLEHIRTDALESDRRGRHRRGAADTSPRRKIVMLLQEQLTRRAELRGVAIGGRLCGAVVWGSGGLTESQSEHVVEVETAARQHGPMTLELTRLNLYGDVGFLLSSVELPHSTHHSM